MGRTYAVIPRYRASSAPNIISDTRLTSAADTLKPLYALADVDHDRRRLLAPLLVMATLWTIVPVLVHTAPPLDLVESAMWGRQWVVGTYKHPAMPAWFIEIGRHLNGGAIGWPAYLASQLFNLATLALTYGFARDVAGARVATAAVLPLLGVEYFSWRSTEFNHTIAQMPFWVGSVWCAWRAIERDSIVWWLALGVMAALGLYAKLSNAMLLLVIAGWILATHQGRRTLATPGPWLAAVVFAVLCIPLVRWLVDSDMQPMAYANARGRDQSLAAALLFPVNTALQAAPIALVLALAGVFRRRGSVDAASEQMRPAATRFLLVMAVGPPLLSIAMALGTGSGLRASWLAPALPLLTVLLVSHFTDRLTGDVIARIGRIGLVLAAAIPIGYALAVPFVNRMSSAPPLRVNWPQAEIARTLSAAWTAETHKPLRIVAGSSWMAGLVGIDHPDRPSILTEGLFAFSPWITLEQLSRDGALLVWTDFPGNPATPQVLAMTEGRPIKEIKLPFPRGRPGLALVVKYAVLPPR